MITVRLPRDQQEENRELLRLDEKLLSFRSALLRLPEISFFQGSQLLVVERQEGAEVVATCLVEWCWQTALAQFNWWQVPRPGEREEMYRGIKTHLAEYGVTGFYFRETWEPERQEPHAENLPLYVGRIANCFERHACGLHYCAIESSRPVGYRMVPFNRQLHEARALALIEHLAERNWETRAQQRLDGALGGHPKSSVVLAVEDPMGQLVAVTGVVRIALDGYNLPLLFSDDKALEMTLATLEFLFRGIAIHIVVPLAEREHNRKIYKRGRWGDSSWPDGWVLKDQ